MKFALRRPLGKHNIDIDFDFISLSLAVFPALSIFISHLP